jgi:hypothetical protein
MLKIGPESDAVLWDLFHHYLRDMAEWFEVDANPDGSYSLRHVGDLGERVRCVLGEVGGFRCGVCAGRVGGRVSERSWRACCS